MAVSKKTGKTPRKSATGSLVSKQGSSIVKKADPGSTRAFSLGSPVKVHFGARDFTAKVLGITNDRVTVEISIDDAAEPIITSYSARDVEILK